MLAPAALEFMLSRNTVFAAAALVLAAAASARAIRRRAPEVHKRGVILRDRTSRRLASRRLLAPPADAVTLAGVSISARDETKHFKIIGTTGTGKSTVIREILDAALAREADIAVALLQQHIRRTGENVLAAIDAGSH